MNAKARYVMIGGFLGAGKSTTVAELATRLVAEGRSVGLITNDQGTGLVDTASLRSRGFAVEEIAGGCFCCRFNSLREAAEKLDAATRPDVFIAEPVGSCTDLVATVSYPLRRLYGDDFVIAPLTVLVDPIRALRVLGIENGRRFSSKVTYVYEKQLEEADIIAINKIDLLDADRLATLRGALANAYPDAEIIEISAREEIGLDAWFTRVLESEMGVGRPLDIDYDIYAEGEALLGWLNCTIAVVADDEIDANDFLERYARRLQQRLDADGADVAHLKMTLSPGGGLDEIALVSLVRQDFVPELALRLDEPIRGAQLIVNLRAEGSPEGLEAAVREETRRYSDGEPLDLRFEHLESFRPGRPRPTHRFTAPNREPVQAPPVGPSASESAAGEARRRGDRTESIVEEEQRSPAVDADARIQRGSWTGS